MSSDLELWMEEDLTHGGCNDFIREYRFHPQRRWRLDFAWPERKVALEVEGGTWINGRHNRGSSFEADCEKYNEAAILGWRVIRVTGSMVEDGRALSFVQRLVGHV